jgi:hypothetical protein
MTTTTAAYMRKYRARKRGAGKRGPDPKFPTALTCECGNRALWIANVTQLTADEYPHQVDMPICRNCRKFFRDSEVRPALVDLRLSVEDYYSLLDYLASMQYVATHAIGRAKPGDMENAIERMQTAINLLHGNAKVGVKDE